jgi:hypothetical protein
VLVVVGGVVGYFEIFFLRPKPLILQMNLESLIIPDEEWVEVSVDLRREEMQQGAPKLFIS